MFIFSLLITGVLSFLQTTSFTLWGVKPNLVLSFLVAYALWEKDWLMRSALIILSSVIINWSPGLNPTVLLVFFILLAAAAAVDYLGWLPLINGAIAVGGATLLINLDSLRISVLASELIYNCLLLAGFYYLLGLLLDKLKANV